MVGKEYAVKPPVVVSISDNAAGLPYTLASLRDADIPDGVPLTLVAEQTAALGDLRASAAQAWRHGPVTVLPADERDALMTTGALATEHGAAILLSDRLIVSPQFFRYAQQAVAAYVDDDRIATVSLLPLGQNAHTGQPFIPLLDAGDTFFACAAVTDGAIITAAQWAAFSDRRATASGATDWPAFLAASGRYNVFPRDAMSTAAPAGAAHQPLWQRPPLNRFKREFELLPLAESVAVYDAHLEMLPDRLNRLTSQFAGLNYALDLYAMRDLSRLAEPYVITSRRCLDALYGFGKRMRPMEANLIAGLAGEEIHLAPVSAVDLSTAAATAARSANDAYFRRQQQTGGRELLALHAAGWAQAAKARTFRGRR